MRKIKIIQHISLDGVIAQAEDSRYGDWTASYRTPEGLKLVMDTHGSEFDLLLGRRTYDLWSAFWPDAGNHPMGRVLNAATKYVVTHRNEGLDWGPVEQLEGIAETVKLLKNTIGPDLIISGSLTVVSELLKEKLVDEVVLIVYPVILGAGKYLFSESNSILQFNLIDTKVTPTGVVLNTYHIAP